MSGTLLARVRRAIRVGVTLMVLVCACVAGVAIWNVYLVGPWTRDGQVQAYAVDIAPEVSGRIVELAVRDNQAVRRGDLLYRIDPSDYEIALGAAQANVESKQADLRLRQAEAARRAQLTTLSTSREEQQTYAINAQVSAAAYAQAMTQLSQARINLARTRVVSPVNGYVTNLQLRLGDYASSGVRTIAILDSDSFYVTAYFEETKLAGIHLGDRAVVALLGYKSPLRGHVESIARGISTPNADPGTLGLATVNPVFTWVRLAQRIPVRIHIDAVPDGVVLAAGMTATVTVGPEADPASRHGWISRVF